MRWTTGATLLALSVRASSEQLLLLSPGIPGPLCATYHGTDSLARFNLFHLAPACSAGADDIGPIPFLGWDAGELYWIEDSPVTPERAVISESSAVQTVFSLPRAQKEIILSTSGDLKLVHFPREFVDELMREYTTSPSHALLELSHISPTPLPRTSEMQLLKIPIPTQRLINDLQNLTFSPRISSLLASFPVTQIRTNLLYLSGEDQSIEGPHWKSRNSMSEGGLVAGKWAIAKLRGYGLSCEEMFYREGFSPNLVCLIPGKGKIVEKVIISAHYDGRGTFGNATAPGANDDGSGTALILTIASHIQSHQLIFSHDVYIVLFSGEEQGLLGSAALARKFQEEKMEIKLMLQTDMVGYRVPGEPMQLALPATIGLPEAAYLVGNISTLYVPSLVVGTTTDHQSFHALSYPATQIFERNGFKIADPMYHNSGDLVLRQGYDIEQVHAAGKVVLATLLVTAGFEE